MHWHLCKLLPRWPRHFSWRQNRDWVTTRETQLMVQNGVQDDLGALKRVKRVWVTNTRSSFGDVSTEDVSVLWEIDWSSRKESLGSWGNPRDVLNVPTLSVEWAETWWRLTVNSQCAQGHSQVCFATWRAFCLRIKETLSLEIADRQD